MTIKELRDGARPSMQKDPPERAVQKARPSALSSQEHLYLREVMAPMSRTVEPYLPAIAPHRRDQLGLQGVYGSIGGSRGGEREFRHGPGWNCVA